MGIKDFYKTIEEEDPDLLKITPFEELRGKVVAVDISVFLYKFVRSAGPGRWADAFIMLLILLKKYSIKAVCIFDGPNPPIEKQEEQIARRETNKKLVEKMEHARVLLEQTLPYLPNMPIPSRIVSECKIVNSRMRQTDMCDYKDPKSIVYFLKETIGRLNKQTIPITEEFKDDAKEIIDALGISFMDAEGEAEGLCSELAVHHRVDAVLTEDTDVMAYGIPEMWGRVDLRNETVTVLRSKDIHTTFGINYRQFRDICIMLGCDYNDRLYGIGYKKIPSLIQEHGSIEAVISYLQKEAKPVPKRDYNSLKYERCREIFSIPRTLTSKYVIPYNRPPNERRIRNFLEERPTNYTYEKITDAWEANRAILIFE